MSRLYCLEACVHTPRIIKQHRSLSGKEGVGVSIQRSIAQAAPHLSVELSATLHYHEHNNASVYARLVMDVLTGNLSLAIYEEAFSLNHACSFSRARPRWDILFFSAFSISAYLYVDYTNTCQQFSNG